VIVRIVGPMDVNAITFRALLELFKVLRKIGKDVLFGFGSEIPKLFPLTGGGRRTIPCNAHRPDQSIKMEPVNQAESAEPFSYPMQYSSNVKDTVVTATRRNNAVFRTERKRLRNVLLSRDCLPRILSSPSVGRSTSARTGIQLHPKTFNQLKGGNADFWIKRIDITGNHQSHFPPGLLSRLLMGGN
jgi:hypothetical protein